MSPVYTQKYFSGTLFVPFPTRDTRFQSDMLDIGCCFAKNSSINSNSSTKKNVLFIFQTEENNTNRFG